MKANAKYKITLTFDEAICLYSLLGVVGGANDENACGGVHGLLFSNLIDELSKMGLNNKDYSNQIKCLITNGSFADNLIDGGCFQLAFPGKWDHSDYSDADIEHHILIQRKEVDQLSEKIGKYFIGKHPGVYLRSLLESNLLTATDVAKKINVPINRITTIMHGNRGITAETASLLSTIFEDINCREWLVLQNEYKLQSAIPASMKRLSKNTDYYVYDDSPCNLNIIEDQSC